ncbi:hypothetical protein BH11GEM1_BH11GEM1_02300 [soil metagenome]
MARLITFGGLSVVNGTVTNGAANPRSRLAILAVIAATRGRGIRREKLLAMFWPDSDDARARNALRQALFTMRRDLGAAEVTVGLADLRLDPAALTSDVADFDGAMEAGHFADAVAVYAGPFLDGVYIRESPEFERWAEEQRQRRAGDYARALEELAAKCALEGDRHGAAEWWRWRAGHDPMSARVAKAFMEALADAGDVEAALRHAEVHSAMVRAELDTEPDPEVTRLAERLRRPRAAHGGTGFAPGVVAPRDAEIPTLPLASTIAPKVVEGAVPPLRAPVFGRRGWLVVAACGVAATMFILGAMRRDSRAIVIVTPFENETGDSASKLTGTVAANWISEGLAQTRLVDVVDFGVALERRAEANKATTSLELAHASHASMLVSGSVSRDGDSLRFDARIIRVRDGTIAQQLPPVRFRAGDQGHAIEQLRQRVLGAFAPFGDDRFLPWANATSTAPRYDAYQEFASGLDATARGDSGAEHHFLNAARLDTTFVQAKLAAVPDDGSEESFALGDSLLRSAEAQRQGYTPFDQVALDEGIAFHRGEWEFAYQAAQRMVELAPSSRSARLRLINDAMGTMRYREAVQEYHLLDRSGWIVNWEYFWQMELGAHHAAGDYEAELGEARTALDQHPRSAGVCGLQLRALAALGRLAALDSAIAYCGSLPGAPEPPFLEWLAGRELFAHGHHAAASRVLDRALRRSTAMERGQTPAAANLAMYMGDWRPQFEITKSRLTADTTDFMTYGQHGVAAAHLGDTATARAMERHHVLEAARSARPDGALARLHRRRARGAGTSGSPVAPRGGARCVADLLLPLQRGVHRTPSRICAV